MKRKYRKFKFLHKVLNHENFMNIDFRTVYPSGAPGF